MPGAAARRLCLSILSGLLLVAGASAESLDQKIQAEATAATFEVVVAIPKADPLTYEKPLPLELLPLKLREATHLPIGTTFRIGRNQFVSASHVLLAGVGSQWGAPLVRDRQGRIYPIEQILKYSSREDFVVFSLKDPPRSPVLKTGDEPQPGSTVYAVGNALGDGIIIRDGTYTSSTPEQQDGKWNWLRFSAATSPGNSGGPLLDGKGRVVGVVVAKSPNENLNYALPIANVLAGQKDVAHLESRSPFGVPFAPETIVLNINESFALPLSFQDFANAVQAINRQTFDRARAQLLAANAGSYFPKGEDSVELLNSNEEAYDPRLVIKKANRWEAKEPDDTEKTDLGGGGYMQAGQIADTGLVRIHVPDGTKPADLLASSKGFMDLFLKGTTLTRVVGTDSVRITSLGPAKTESKFTDSYGRQWMLWSWDLPYLDSRMTSAVLPVPDGFIVLSRTAPTVVTYQATELVKMAADLIYVTYTGTWPQWQQYLELSAMRPSSLAAMSMSIDPARGFIYRSSRFDFTADNQLMDFGKRNVVDLQLSYFPDKGKVDWDVIRLCVHENADRKVAMCITRSARPPKSLSQARMDLWQDLLLRHRPYDSRPGYQAPYLGVSTTVTRTAPNAGVPIAADANVLYAAGYWVAGTGFSPSDMQGLLKTVVDGLRVKE